MKIHTLAIIGLFLITGAAVIASKVMPARAGYAPLAFLGLLLLAGALFVLAWQQHHKVAQEQHYWKRQSGKLYNMLSTESNYGKVMSSINDLIEVFGKTRDLDAVLNEAVEALDVVLDIDVLVLQLYSSEDSRFFKRIERGASDVDLGDELQEDLLDRHMSRLINNLKAEKRYHKLSEGGYEALIAAPLLRNLPDGSSEAIGFIVALTRERVDFTSQELEMLSLFAREAGLIIENAYLYQKTRHMATHDGLTNLVNQRQFKRMLRAELENARARSSSLCFIMVDIDHFKNYNDTWGHPQGDKALRAVADVLIANTRGGDTVARYGGEEFALILPDTGLEGAKAVGENIRKSIQELDLPGVEEQPGGFLSVTMGIAHYPGDANEAEELISTADEALYYGKSHGRNQVVVAWDKTEEIEQAMEEPDEESSA